ncbi:putative transmembrane protein [Pseudonocardia sp. Ae168_Ps1]|uniref:DUF2637 domain-containing protein n=1 Tax=unclassified Pseudonocardia TaxID=2619320 RepID=UPI00094B4561|nr:MULTISPECIES: DUF2637 domain-containing protein [unclassified Pseudonocardia]OLL69912.1 putative transmembrane protein [Pseudonocardia sp. Ae150A_Ps1]OLL70108.1 putative transmembrane protein [Pseudonocardia sp. Ae168_Ps1]OLL70379.1 putative transmembrane protein [Pseudonocardia sp. Ae263_Ps1]OLL89160.1 putative transmembrane protein [Pseudonocardia sp. Ae356_Ps1]
MINPFKRRRAVPQTHTAAGEGPQPPVTYGPQAPRPGRDWSRFGAKALTGTRAALLGVVVLAPEAAAWQGLLALARDTFRMTDGWEYLVPLLFGAAAFYVALLAQRYVLRGDSAMTERALTWLYAAAGAGFNFWHASTVLNETASAIFFGGASLSAALLWDRTLRAWRRDQLREIGALEQPLPRFRALRWLLALPTTFRAFRFAVLHGLSTPAEALAAVEMAAERTRSAKIARQYTAQTERAAQTERSELTESDPAAHDAVLTENTDDTADKATAEADETATDPHGIPVVPAEQPRTSLAELVTTSGKAAAVREAWRMMGVGPDEHPTRDHIEKVVELFARQDIRVTEKYAREVRRRMKAAQAPAPRPVALVKAVNS